MEQNELINVMCFIKDKYRAAISGDVCCVREISGNEAKIEIFENSSFRKCTVPIEVLDIHEGLMTISEMCHEIELCASRYLQEHHIEQVSPDSENYERWKIEKSFLRSWTQPDNHYYGSEQEQKILTERTKTFNGFSLGVCGKGKAIQGVSGSGMSLLAKAKTVESLIQSDDPVAEV